MTSRLSKRSQRAERWERRHINCENAHLQSSTLEACGPRSDTIQRPISRASTFELSPNVADVEYSVAFPEEHSDCPTVSSLRNTAYLDSWGFDNDFELFYGHGWPLAGYACPCLISDASQLVCPKLEPLEVSLPRTGTFRPGLPSRFSIAHSKSSENDSIKHSAHRTTLNDSSNEIELSAAYSLSQMSSFLYDCQTSPLAPSHKVLERSESDINCRQNSALADDCLHIRDDIRTPAGSQESQPPVLAGSIEASTPLQETFSRAQASQNWSQCSCLSHALDTPSMVQTSSNKATTIAASPCELPALILQPVAPEQTSTHLLDRTSQLHIVDENGVYNMQRAKGLYAKVGKARPKGVQNKKGKPEKKAQKTQKRALLLQKPTINATQPNTNGSCESPERSGPNLEPSVPCKRQRGRKSVGCWTCKLRRKLCEGRKPVCKTCERLELNCDGYGTIRPSYMVDPAENAERRAVIRIEPYFKVRGKKNSSADS